MCCRFPDVGEPEAGADETAAEQSAKHRNILWATPSAAGPRSLLIASGLEILSIVATRSWHPWCPDLSFGMLGGLTLVPGGPWVDLRTL